MDFRAGAVAWACDAKTHSPQVLAPPFICHSYRFSQELTLNLVYRRHVVLPAISTSRSTSAGSTQNVLHNCCNHAFTVSATTACCVSGIGVRHSRCRRMLHTIAGIFCTDFCSCLYRFSTWFPIFCLSRVAECNLICARCFGLAINPFHDQLTVIFPLLSPASKHYHYYLSQICPLRRETEGFCDILCNFHTGHLRGGWPCQTLDVDVCVLYRRRISRCF